MSRLLPPKCNACGSHNISAIPTSVYWNQINQQWELEESASLEELECMDCCSHDCTGDRLEESPAAPVKMPLRGGSGRSNFIIYDADGSQVGTVRGDSFEALQVVTFIVSRCNAHDELVAIAQRIERYAATQTRSEPISCIERDAKALLAKVGAA